MFRFEHARSGASSGDAALAVGDFGDAQSTRDGIVSRSPALRDVLDRIDRVAPTSTTVLISGETGTGKELVARAIHRRSRRVSRPFVAVNLAAIPEPLLASELFGHEHGAFTGAVQRRIGRFEQAERGTLFLDEIGELSNEMQVALLRVLQEGEFERLGGSQTRQADVRIIAATHRCLEHEVDLQRFRSDLYYRVSVFPIHLPPLRERTADIRSLVQHFMREVGRRLGRLFSDIEPSSLERMEAFSWPGNIRQLENVVEQSAILCDGPVLTVPDSLLQEAAARPAAAALERILERREREAIEMALAETGGQVAGAAGAAAQLGVPPSTLESKIRRLQIDKLTFRRPRRR